MARRSPQPPEPHDVRRFTDTAEVDAAIAKLRRRVADINAIRDEQVPYNEARVDNVEHAIRDAIREVFGKDSPEFNRHAYFQIDDGPKSIRFSYGGRGPDHLGNQRKFAERIPGALVRIEGLIQSLEERKVDLATPPTPAAALAGRRLNPAIAAAAQSLYDDGHYPQAVVEAGKALVALVKVKSGRYDIDGKPLMEQVFSVKAPTLAFNDLSDQSDLDEQQGLMFLYAGAVLAVRNPGSHRVGVIEHPDRALQHLELLSYLADRLDESKKVK